MVHVLVILESITGISHQSLAFFLPPMLASLLIIPCVLWGCRSKRPEAGIVAAVLLSISPYWFARTRAGYFDTDPLIPFWVLMALYGIWRFTGVRGKRRFLYLACALSACFMADLWWPQTKLTTLGMSVGAYVLTVFLPSSRIERRVKIAMALVGVGVLGMVLTGGYTFLPGKISELLASLKSHADLVFSGSAGGNLPAAHVGELSGLDSFQTMKFINGSYLGLIVSIIGLGFLAIRDKRAALVLAPLALAGSMMLIAARFAIFFLPLYAIGGGFFCSEARRNAMVAETLKHDWQRNLFSLVIAASFIIPSMAVTLNIKVNPPYNSTQAAMAERIGTLTDPGTTIWATWSKGYFIEAYADRTAFSDGGTLSPLHLYINTAALSFDDPMLSAFWMKLFSAHGLAPIDRVKRALRTEEAGAVAFLRDLFTAPSGERKALLEINGLTPVEEWLGYFYPKAKVAVYLDHLMLRTAPNWFRRGTWDFIRQNGLEGEVIHFDGQGRRVEYFAENLILMGKKKEVGTIISVKDRHATRKRMSLMAEGTLVDFSGDPAYYYLGPQFEKSLFYKLLFATGDVPGFKRLYHDGRHGLWLVE